jgi:hypothetical protein
MAEVLQPRLAIPALDSLACLVQASIAAARLGLRRPVVAS